MRRILFTLMVLFAMMNMVAQDRQMHVNLKNGSVLNVFLSEIEDITWDYDAEGGDVNNPEEPTVTGDATEITHYSATLTCYANNILDNLSNDLKVGIIYSTEGTPSKSNGTQNTVSTYNIGSDGKYTISLTGLTEGTTYYYRSFVYQSGIWFYGNVRSFTTLGQNLSVNFMTGDATSITCYSAKVAAQMTISAPDGYGSMEYGICYGTTAEPTNQQRVTSKDASGNYTATLRGLKGNTIYYYRPYAVVDGTTYYGSTSSFRTLEDNVVTTGEADENGNVRSKLTIGSGAYSKLELGVCWSTANDVPTVNDDVVTTNEVDDENYFTVCPKFYFGTNYYRSFVKIDGVAHYGETKQVTIDWVVGNAVDLGLSVKWADMNVGATSPEGYGYYYAWGETEPKSVYLWSNYKYYDGRFDTLTKYCTNSSYGTVDNKTVLDPEDDVAHVKWGGDWRMPTWTEQYELLDKCTWTWTSCNGVNGYIVTGPNGNSIFLADNNYWSNSLYVSNSVRAYSLFFNKSDLDLYIYVRYTNGSVRAVCP